jgi:hypothetical protein
LQSSIHAPPLYILDDVIISLGHLSFQHMMAT